MEIIEDDGLLCKHLALLAGKILLDLRCSHIGTNDEIGKIGDLTANRVIIEELKHQRPNDAILSEEMADNQSRLKQNRVWIIDPLDGTREYSEGRDDWAVHIALAIGGKAVFGAVAIPGKNKIFSTDSVLELKSANNPPKMLISRTRPQESAKKLAKHIGAELLQMGSAGAKAMAIIEGIADIYFHIGGQYEWDNCAPIAVANAAGLYVGDIYGRKIIYNKSDKYVPNLLICRKEYARPIIAWVLDNL